MRRRARGGWASRCGEAVEEGRERAVEDSSNTRKEKTCMPCLAGVVAGRACLGRRRRRPETRRDETRRHGTHGLGHCIPSPPPPSPATAQAAVRYGKPVAVPYMHNQEAFNERVEHALAPGLQIEAPGRRLMHSLCWRSGADTRAGKVIFLLPQSQSHLSSGHGHGVPQEQSMWRSPSEANKTNVENQQ